MKGLINDTIWFKSPDGGEVKMSMGGYSPEQIVRLKATMSEEGWVVVSHETKTQNNWACPTWVIPYLLGVLVGTAFYWLFSR